MNSRTEAYQLSDEVDQLIKHHTEVFFKSANKHEMTKMECLNMLTYLRVIQTTINIVTSATKGRLEEIKISKAEIEDDTEKEV
jgi:hypothetical protein